MPPTSDSVKKNVRSVLITHPQGVLLSKFVAEYQDLCGSKIPYANFGFRSLIDFLGSLKDAVIVTPLTTSRDFLLNGIADAKNAHVQKLVTGQKLDRNSVDARMIKNKLSSQDRMALQRNLSAVSYLTERQLQEQKKRSQSSPPPSSRNSTPSESSRPPLMPDPPPQVVRPPLFNSPPIARYRPPTQSDAPPPQRSVPSTQGGTTPALWSLGRSRMRVAVQAKPPGVQEPRRQSSRVSPEGQPISRPGSVNSGSSRDANFMRVIQNQITPRGGRVSTEPRVEEPQTIGELRERVREVLREFPDGISISLFPDCYYNRFGFPLVPQRFNAESIPLLLSKQLSSTVRLVHDVGTITIYLRPQEPPEPEPVHISTSRVKELKKRIVSLCDKHRESGVDMRKFHKIYEDEFREAVDLESLGMRGLRLLDVLANFNDVLKVEDVQYGNESRMVLYRVGFPPKWLKEMSKKRYGVPDPVKENMNTLLRFHRQTGIPEEKVIISYFSLFASEIDFKSYGFENFSEMIDHLEGDVLRKIVDSSGRTILRHLPDREKDQMYLPMPASEFNDSVSVPDNVVHPDEPYKPSVLPDNIGPKSEICLTAGDIMSPSYFYFHVCDSSCKSELDPVAEELDVFYQKYDMDYAVPKSQVSIGMVVVGEWSGVWYRARITNIQDLQTVRLIYFDYGTRDIVPMENIRYMNRKFYELPAQAYIGRLAGICALTADGQPSTIWQNEAKRLLVNWFQNRALYGIVVEIIPKEGNMTNIVEIELYYTHNGEDFCINDRLVELGFASYKPAYNLQTPEPPPPLPTVPKPAVLSRRAAGEERVPLASPAVAPVAASVPDVVPSAAAATSGIENISPLLYNFLTSPMAGYLTEEQIRVLTSPRFSSLDFANQVHVIKQLLGSQINQLSKILQAQQWDSYQQSLNDYINRLATATQTYNPPNNYSPGVTTGNPYSSPTIGPLLGCQQPRSFGTGVASALGSGSGLLMPARDLPQSASPQSAPTPIAPPQYTPTQPIVQASPAVAKPTEGLGRLIDDLGNLSGLAGDGMIPPPKIKRVNVTPMDPIYVLRFGEDVYVTAACLATVIPTAVSPRALELQLKFKKSKVTPLKLKTSEPALVDSMVAMIGADVPGVFKNDNDVVEYIHLYLLSMVPVILNDLGVTSQELRTGFNAILADYRFNGAVWSA